MTGSAGTISCNRVFTVISLPVTDSKSCVTEPSVPSRIFCTGESLPTCASISLRQCAISIATKSPHERISVTIQKS